MDGHRSRPFALVTGASSGIGLELARELARNGFDLLLTAEDGRLEPAAREVERHGVDVETFTADLSTDEGVDRLYRRVQEMDRPLEAVALNAGVGEGGAFLDNPLEKEMRLIRLNVLSTVHLAKHVIPDMVARGRGRVLITSSISAETPGPYAAVYNASKAFGLSFGEALHNELEEKGVTVTVLMPGATDTDFFRRAGMEDTKVAQSEKDDPADVARAGVEGMLEGDDMVVPGTFMTKLQHWVSGIMPESVKAEQHAKVARPGSAEGEKAGRPPGSRSESRSRSRATGRAGGQDESRSESQPGRSS